MIHVEDYILNFSPIRHNRNSYPRKDNNGGDDSSMVFYMSVTWVTLSSLIIQFPAAIIYHVGDSKYRILSSKKYITTNITIHKINENIESNKIWRLLTIKE